MQLQRLTFVEHIADRTVIDDHDSAQIRLDGRQVLDIRAISLSAILPVESAMKVFSLRF